MTINKKSVENVLPVLSEWMTNGQRVCLVTLYKSYAATPRPLGSQMVVSENGQWFGYLSGGCAEQAIASEAVNVINQGENRSVRYGLGSPYLDIQLPCGAGIDIWFDQAFNHGVCKQILAQIESRSVVGIESSIEGKSNANIVNSKLDRLAGMSFRRWYFPRRRLYIIGAGPSVTALTILAIDADYDVEIFSSDENTLAEVSQFTNQSEFLRNQSQIQSLPCDRWTSVVLMFHEHHRETKILEYFVTTDVVYIGALGSVRTHKSRIDKLKQVGIRQSLIERISGPIGLDIGAQSPMEIAISVIAELTLVYQAASLAQLEVGNGIENIIPESDECRD